ncbi:hypothetical protein NA644_12335 [Pseudomonas stutzeri]|jgi:hypothetical protein|uniref:Uncharacterized protein n=1 Tax=Stutzerimonas stutzeri TaxID=316 RepID=A0A2N8SNA3_STUST|nr:hypothetical protein [Stutzerimonas stutzeri]EQM76400.1 hypothetical protein L686_17150 [Stutzerimonas stutzeri MF28]MCQ4250094.1 hypothetical protein [Stutzerimonas stutzeri]PNG03968.1 hypothetical protein CXL00_17440 [Stutzerimonas stutzeri]
MKDYDVDALEEKLIRVAIEVFGYEKFAADTPMHEIRSKAEQAGMMFGRAFAAAVHSGPITAELAMEIRASEQRGKDRFLDAVNPLCGPGGELRRTWND